MDEIITLGIWADRVVEKVSGHYPIWLGGQLKSQDISK